MVNSINFKGSCYQTCRSEKSKINTVNPLLSVDNADKITFTAINPPKAKLVDVLVEYHKWLTEKIDTLPKEQIEPYKECYKMFKKSSAPVFKRIFNSVTIKDDETMLRSLSKKEARELTNKYSTWLFFRTGGIFDKEQQKPYLENYKKFIDLVRPFVTAKAS